VIWILAIIVLTDANPNVLHTKEGFQTEQECKTHMKSVSETLEHDGSTFAICIEAFVPGVDV
jgi:hypothetical protein